MLKRRDEVRRDKMKISNSIDGKEFQEVDPNEYVLYLCTHYIHMHKHMHIHV